MRPVVAEEHGVAALRGHFQLHIREDGGPALLGGLQVDDQRGHALAAALQNTGSARLVRIKVIVVRLVLGTRLVLQHLQAFAVHLGPVQQAGDAGLDALDQRVLAALEKHAVAGAVHVHFFAAALGFYRERAAQARAGQVQQRGAFLVTEQAAQHHQPRLAHDRQHRHLAVTRIQPQGGAVECGAGHGHGGGALRMLVLVLHVRGQGGFQGGNGHVLVPAGCLHGREHHVGRKPGLGLRDDPFAQCRCGRLRRRARLSHGPLRCGETPAGRAQRRRRQNRSPPG